MALEIESKDFKEISKELGIDKGGKMQKKLDNTLVGNLMAYVSFRSGSQQKSIKNATVLGSGEITINVPYAEFQAYSNKIRDRDPKDPKRGKYPWERMIQDKKKDILDELVAYAKIID